MKNIIVTGGSGTIGTAIAEVLLRNGYKVYVVDVKEPEKKANQVFIHCDVTKYDDLTKAFRREFDGSAVDGIVTVAGGVLPEEWSDFSDTDMEVIRKSIELNLVGHINAVHAVLPYLIASKEDKSITMISSINGMAAYRIAGYSASKAGLAGFMYGIAKEMGEKGIRVNVVSPGTVVTELTLRESKKEWSKLREGTLTGQFAVPEDIAQLVYMLICNKSIAGQNIVIDSGQLIKK